jgi:hypothetical protein
MSLAFDNRQLLEFRVVAVSRRAEDFGPTIAWKAVLNRAILNRI